MPRLKKTSLFILWLLISVCMAAGLVWLNNLPLSIEEPAPLQDTLPPAHAPAGMKLYQIPTGVNHRSAAFAYQGGSYFDKREFSMSATLIHHPQGDLLIDAGLGSRARAHFKSMPLYFQMTTDFDPQTPASKQLILNGYSRDSLKAIMLTHAHWDHVSGIEDFKNTPILVSPGELEFIHSHNMLSALAASFKNARYQSYTFEKKTYLGFAESYDYYGDGSVVLASAPGHTPGSVIIFVNLPDGKRYAFIGDLAWQTEGIDLLREKPRLQSMLGDSDRGAVRTNLKKMYAIRKKYPEIQIVPAHDARAFSSIPIFGKP